MAAPFLHPTQTGDSHTAPVLEMNPRHSFIDCTVATKTFPFCLFPATADSSLSSEPSDFPTAASVYYVTNLALTTKARFVSIAGRPNILTPLRALNSTSPSAQPALASALFALEQAIAN